MVAGATGLVGREIVKQLRADSRIGQVHCLVRKPSGLAASNCTEHVVDWARLEACESLAAVQRIDAVLIALGTTIKVAGSQAAFRAVDFDAVLAAAEFAQAKGASRVGVISALGPSKSSPVFYSRVKAEMEDAVRALGLVRTVFARPSFIEGDRAALGQVDRPGEGIALTAARLFNVLIPRKYKAVRAADIASGLIAASLQGSGVQALESGELWKPHAA